MADLNVALILRLVDRFSGPGRAAAQALTGLANAARRAGVGAAQQAGKVDQAGKSMGRTAAAATRATVAEAALSRAGQAAAAGQRSLATATTAAGAGGARAASGAQRAGAATGQMAHQASAATAAALKLMGGLDMAAAASQHATEQALKLMGGQDGSARSAGTAARAEGDLARSTERAGAAADGAARRLGRMERAQMRGRAAMRALRGEYERFDRAMGTVAKVQIATEGLSRPAHALRHVVTHSVGEAATFSGGMTGMGITAEMSDAQLAPIRQAILDTSRRYALTPEAAQETFAFTRRSGVFTRPAEIIAAGAEAAKFQKLAERMGSPVEGEEAAGGASSAVREYGFAATPKGIQRYFAMIDAAEKTGGGMKVSDLLQYSRSAGGIMRSFGAGNERGLADVLAGQQLSMFLSHSGGQAGINFQDMLAYIGHKMTVRRFAKEGVDLPAVMQAGYLQGQSPVETWLKLVDRMTTGKTGPEKEFAISHLVGNQQAGQATMAGIQNLDKFIAYRNQVLQPRAVPQYEADVARATSGPTADLERLKSTHTRLDIAFGNLLLPATGRAASALEGLASWATRTQEHGGPLAKTAAFGVTALAGLATAVVSGGHAITGVAATWLTFRFLSRAARLGGVAARGGLLGRLAGLLTGGAARGAAAGAGGAAARTGLIGRALPAAMAVARTVGSGALGLLARVGPLAMGAIRLVIGGFGSIVRGALAIASVIAAIVDAPVVIVLAIGAAIVAAGVGIWMLVKHWGAVKTWLGGLWTSVSGFVGRFAEAGGHLIAGLARGIAGGAGAVKDAVVGVGTKAVNWLKAHLGIKSPSRVFAGLGRFTMQGFALGLADGRHGVLRQMALTGAALGGALALARPAPLPIFTRQLLAPAALSPAAGRGAGASPGAAAQPQPAGRVVHLALTQHFHLPAAASADPRALAREMKRLGDEGARRALHDMADA